MASHSISAPAREGISKPLNVGLWILQVLAAGVFLMAGSMKLKGALPMVQMFAKIGIGQWFRYFTGGLEVTCAVLMLIPKISSIAAGLLACTMVGAILTHLFIVGGNPATPIGLLLITATAAWVRRPSFLRGR